MAERFTPALLEQIKQRVPISRLVGEYVTADKAKSQPGDLWACCPFHGEKSPSFHAEDSREVYHCFGCGAGGDHFEFVERMERVSFRDAVARVAAMAGIVVEGGGDVRELPPIERPVVVDPYEGYEFVPVPEDIPPLTPGQKTPPARRPKFMGTDKEFTAYTPSAVYPYRNAAGELLGYVIRQDLADGKKITPGLWWVRAPDGYEGWSHGSLPGPRPLYGLDELLANPDKQVLVVEGEKCRDAARVALGGRVVVVSWLGGTSAVHNTDWSPLEGRSVIWWPDNDVAGQKALETARSRANAARNKTVTPYGEKGGDVADLISDGGDVAAYIKGNIGEVATVVADEEIEDGTVSNSRPDLGGHDAGVPDRHAEQDRPSEGPADSRSGMDAKRHAAQAPARLAPDDDPEWERRLERTDKGTLVLNSLHNAMMLLQYHDEFKGIYAYNEFAQEIAILRRPPWEPPRRQFTPRLLTEIDVIANTGFMETLGDFKIKPKVADMVSAIKRVADFNRFNPVVDALDALQWDGLPRLRGGTVGSRTFAPFAVRYFGAENTNINASFVTRTLISAIARAYKPGCKVDTMLVLEGGQGKFKSTSLNVLADAIAPGLFTDEMSDPGSKDAGLQMQGKWVIEISELDAFRKSDVSTLKAWLTRKTDRFRRPYGKAVEEFPRSCIMIGTVNPPESGYLRDPTGARRWWPIRCGEFDLPLLKEDAVQIWAEARELYLAGEQWHLTDTEEEEARIVQAARYESDPWAMMIDEYLRGPIGGMKSTISVMELMGSSCVDIHKERRTPAHNARIEAHLNMVGWRKIDKGLYRRPVVN